MLCELVAPWRSFLADLDAHIEGEVRLHCWGGRDRGVRAGAHDGGDLAKRGGDESNEQRLR